MNLPLFIYMAGATIVEDVAATPEVAKVRSILNQKLDEILKGNGENQ